MVLKSVDVQVWSGQQTIVANGVLVQQDDNNFPHLKGLVCPLTHTWKSYQALSNLNHDELRILQHRAFSIFGGQDKIVWKFNNNGDYTMSSAYWIFFNENHKEAHSVWNSCIWKRLWSLNLLFKLVIFLWKFCTKCLPIRSELHKRVLGISLLCNFCNEENETMEHLFFLCLVVRTIWFGIDLSLRIDGLMINTLKDWIKE